MAHSVRLWVPRLWNYGVLAAVFERQASPSKFLVVSVLYALPCCLALSWKGNIPTDFCKTKWTKASNQTSFRFSIKLEIHRCSRRQDVYKNNIFFIPKSVNMSLPAHMALFKLRILEDTVWCHSIGFRLDSGSKCWTLFSSPGQSATWSCHLQYRISVKISCDFFICVLRACQHSRQPKNTFFGTGRLFVKYHYTGFTDG